MLPVTIIFLLTSHTFDNPNDMDAVNIYCRTIREVSVDLCCEVIPIHTYWAGYLVEHGRVNADLVQRDTRYPNDQGHELFADAVIVRPWKQCRKKANSRSLVAITR